MKYVNASDQIKQKWLQMTLVADPCVVTNAQAHFNHTYFFSNVGKDMSQAELDRIWEDGYALTNQTNASECLRLLRLPADAAKKEKRRPNKAAKNALSCLGKDADKAKNKVSPGVTQGSKPKEPSSTLAELQQKEPVRVQLPGFDSGGSQQHPTESSGSTNGKGKSKGKAKG